MAEELLDDVFGYLLYLTKNRRGRGSDRRDVRDGVSQVAAIRPATGAPRAWLLAIARTTALDWFRADARRRRREERAEAAESRREDEGGFGEGLSPVLEESSAP